MNRNNTVRILPILALSLVAMPALAQQTALLDYGNDDFVTGRQFYSEVDRARIATALDSVANDATRAMGKDFVILGDAAGAFSAPGTQEHIYLIQKEAPVAIDPFPKGPAPLLLALKDDGIAGVWTLPADGQYQRLVAAADGNGDGRSEVLLEGAFMNMGELNMSVDVATLDDKGQATVQQTLSEVLIDSCENEGGTKTRKAATVSVGPDGFTTEQRDIGCGS